MLRPESYDRQYNEYISCVGPATAGKAVVVSQLTSVRVAPVGIRRVRRPMALTVRFWTIVSVSGQAVGG